MTPRILFVDDEAEVLEGLKVRLRQKRQQWKMSFARGAKEALDLLAQEPFSIVVSDLRMPEMDGATLLQEIRRRYPATSRVILSGHGEERLVMRAMACSHEFLPKPSPAGVLESTLERISAFQDVVQDVQVREAVGRIGSLPAQPAVYTKLMTALADQDTSPEAVAAILLADSSLCAQLLHIVNSAYFRLSRPIIKVEEAVLYLGLGTVRQLALVAEVFQDSDAKASVLGVSTQRLQEHSFLTAGIASAILSGYPRRELGFIAALLHDVGKLIIATQLPDRAKKIADRMRERNEPMEASERALFGTTHAEIGGYLLGLWQLPFPIVEAVTHHHSPSRLKPDQLDVVVAVHVANYLAHEQAALAGDAAVENSAHLDLRLLQELGVEVNLNEWRSLAKAHAEKR